jgi:hypothetical protein
MRHLTSPLPCIARHDCRREEFRPIAHRHLSSHQLAAQLAGSAPKGAAPTTWVLSSPSSVRLSYYPAKPMWRFLSQRAPSATTIEVMNKAATMAHSRAPLPWSGSTPKRTSIHSRVMTVHIASPAANVARATSIQNRTCGFTVFGPLYPKVLSGSSGSYA